MTQVTISDQEWKVFVDVADRLGVNLRPSRRRVCGFTSWSRPGTRWDAQSLEPRRNGWLSPMRSVSSGHSLVQRVDSSVRCCIKTGRWRALMVLSNFTNQSAIARLAAGIFFPQRPALGLDQRSYSPAVLDKIVSANAEHKSAYKAQKMLWKLARSVD